MRGRRTLDGAKAGAYLYRMLRTLLSLLLVPFLLLWAALRLLVRLPFPRRVPDFVELKLTGTLRWRDLHRRRWPLGRRRSGPTVEGLEKAVDEILREPKVAGVILKFEEFHASHPRQLALRQALEKLRASGRHVVLYWKAAGNRDFGLVPAASRVILAPGGPVHLLGHAVALTALRDALDKAGIVPEFFRKGRWKTAPERFTHREITPEGRELVERVLDHHHRHLIADVAARRGGDEAWAASVIDGGPYTSRRALDAGLVDELAYPDELPKRLGALIGKEEAKVRPLAALRKSRRWRIKWPRLRRRPRVAVVPIEGLIKPGHSFRWPNGTKMAGDESVAKALDDVRKDRRVKAVIVQIDSRGGAAPASELMWRAVRRCAEEKPTVAWVESVAASGGYFAAAGATRIVAAPGALVGSIGVFSGRFDARALLDRLGIHQEVVARGAHAGILEPAHTLTDDERAVLAAEVDAIYDEFVDRVGEGRRRPADEIRAHAEGRVFVAAEAPPALVDEIGDFRRALAWACAEAGIDPAKAEVAAHEKVGLKLDLGELFALGQAALAGMPLLLWTDEVRVR